MPRFDREIAAGKIGSAMITATRGTRTAPAVIRWAPRFLLAPLLDRAAKVETPHTGGETASPASAPQRRRPVLRILLWPVPPARREAARAPGADEPDVALSALVPTVHYDAQLVLESEGRLADYRAITVPVLLMGGSKSPADLRSTLDALQATLPRVSRVELPGLGHLAPDNTGAPERVAGELLQFFGARGEEGS